MKSVAILLPQVLALATAVLLPATARAEDPPQPIVVTGRGLGDTPALPAYDVQEIARERIVASASGRIEEVLSGIAGFQQFRRSDSRSANPSAQGATLRALGGNATSRTLVLLDGVPMADPFFGTIPFSAISPALLRSARVTRGGGSGAFGSGAVAGTIELASADAEALGPASGEALIDQRGESALAAVLAPRLGQGFAVAAGQWDRGQGFWTTPIGQRVPASVRAGYDSWSASLRAVAPLADDIELQARGLAFADHRTLRFADANSSSTGQDASLRVVGRGRWQFDALGYVQLRDFSNVVISATTFRKTLDQRRTPSTGIGGKFELRPPAGSDHVLRLGGDVRIADGDLQEDAYSTATGLVTARRRAGGRNTDLGLFIEDDWTIGALVLTAGARADRWTIRDGYLRQVTPAGAVTIANSFPDRSGWQGSFRAGAVLDAGQGLSLRAAGYSGLRQPTLNELYRPFVVFPVTTQANAALRNEMLLGYEAGVDFRPDDRVSLSLTAFDNRVRHAIANVTIGPNLRQRQNVGAIHARGIELGAQVHLGQLSLDGALAWTEAQVEASGGAVALDGMRPAQTPRLAASGTLSWRPRPRWLLAMTLQHVGAQFEDDLQTDSLPAATTLQAFAQVPIAGPVSLVLRGENLTDETVVTRNQAGSIDLGAPRTLWVGIRVGHR